MHITDRGCEDVDTGRDEVVDVFGRGEECYVRSATHGLWSVGAHALEITGVSDTILTTFYPPAFRLNCDPFRVTLFSQHLGLLKIFGLVVM